VPDIVAKFLTKFGFSQHIFIEVFNMKFQGNPTSESRADTYGQTDEHDEVRAGINGEPSGQPPEAPTYKWRWNNLKIWC
jgi:hypothetical protein